MFIDPEEEKKFKEFLDLCIEERIDELSADYALSTEYLDINEQIYAVYDALEIALPEESHHLLLEHEALSTDLLNLYQKHFYRQGLMSYFMLRKYFCV